MLTLFLSLHLPLCATFSRPAVEDVENVLYKSNSRDGMNDSKECGQMWKSPESKKRYLNSTGY